MVDGNLFEQGGHSTLNVTLKHEIYVYRKFASFDGKNWQPVRKLLDTHLELQIPQKDGGNAGMLHVKMDRK